MSNIKFGSLNCRGLFSDKIKRTDIFSKCKEDYDVTFLVDTHSTNDIENEWRCEWGSEAFFVHILVIVGELQFYSKTPLNLKCITTIEIQMEIISFWILQFMIKE